MNNFKINTHVKRVVVLGGTGFVGSEIILNLKKKNIPNKSISRNDIDFSNKESVQNLKFLLDENDAVVVACANAPVKNNSMLTSNIIMLENIYNVLLEKKVKKILYISSDAVYGDKIHPLNEFSITNPTSLHGLMHLTREMMIKEIKDIPIAIIRPTLIYGKNDPHNGYGPNSFNRLLDKNENIKLFGEGEEKRDHVYVNDVAELSFRMIFSNFTGVLNAATGKGITFKKVAEKLLNLHGNNNKLVYVPRVGEMPHDGLRVFDPAQTKKNFPDFNYTPIDEGLYYLKNKISL